MRAANRSRVKGASSSHAANIRSNPEHDEAVVAPGWLGPMVEEITANHDPYGVSLNDA